jgi:hypothetical protein
MIEMAKAQLTTKLGTKISIEGTSEEVADLLARFEVEGRPSKANSSVAQNTKPSHARKTLASPANLISELVEAGFFATPKELNGIKVALEEQGHFYPVTTLSPTLLRLVRKRRLRRIKENKRWIYVA